MKILSVVFFLLLIPFDALARADLKIEQADVRFSSDVLIAGDEVRLYASIHNIADEDVSGYVSFYQGATLLGTSQVISVLASGSAEEVYIDFIVPSSTFNIQAQVEGTDPVDEDESNNVAITPRVEPLVDDDRDGIENEGDNCPGVVNAQQTDTDGDGEGNACDSDDDNDELTDDVEEEIGTSPTMTDTDGDGVEDQSDAFPTDSEKVNEEEISITEESQAAQEETNRSVTFKEIISQVAATIQESAFDAAVETEQVMQEAQQTQQDEQSLEDHPITFSPNLIFSYTRESWNTFTFVNLGVISDDQSLVWDFGDGVTSSKSVVSHTFGAPGSYTITLRLNLATGELTREQTSIHIPFFSLQNPVVLMVVLILSLLLLMGLAWLGANFLKDRKPVQILRVHED